MNLSMIGLIILGAPGGIVAFIIMLILQLLGVKHQAEGGIGVFAMLTIFFSFIFWLVVIGYGVSYLIR